MTAATTRAAPRILPGLCGAGGPRYEYRGAFIASNEKGTVFSFFLEGFPRSGWSGLGNLEMIVRLVDSWLDLGRLPPSYVDEEASEVG